MVSAVGPNPIANVALSSVPSTAGIEAQLARDKKELSNCVNCASAETRQGQADIEALTNKINVAEARLKEVATDTNVQAAVLGPAEENEASLNEAANNGVDAAGGVEANSSAIVPGGINLVNESTVSTSNESESGAGRFVDEYV